MQMKLAFKETLGSQAPDNSGVCKATGAHDGLRLVKRTSSWSPCCCTTGKSPNLFLDIGVRWAWRRFKCNLFFTVSLTLVGLVIPRFGKSRKASLVFGLGPGNLGRPRWGWCLACIDVVAGASAIFNPACPWSKARTRRTACPRSKAKRTGQCVHGQRPDGQYVHVNMPRALYLWRFLKA